MRISSASNSKVKLVQRLRTKRGRLAEARFVIDYGRDLQRALNQGFEVDFALICPPLMDDDSGLDLTRQSTYELPPALFRKLSYRENPDGIIAVMRSHAVRGRDMLDALNIETALLLVGPRVPGNIGALMRTADAAAIDAVILVDCALDLYNPNIIRSSAGACFRDNVFQLRSAEAIALVNANGMQLIAADGKGDISLYDADFSRPAAIALGAEDRGLPAEWLEICDCRAAIPMSGQVSDSLNVSVSGALFMYEMLRQRAVSQRLSQFDS